MKRNILLAGTILSIASLVSQTQPSPKTSNITKTKS